MRDEKISSKLLAQYITFSCMEIPKSMGMPIILGTDSVSPLSKSITLMNSCDDISILGIGLTSCEDIDTVSEKKPKPASVNARTYNEEIYINYLCVTYTFLKASFQN